MMMFNKNLKYYRLKNNMTKKDFEAVAYIVAVASRGQVGRNEKRGQAIEKRLAELNPRFDAEKFWQAVGGVYAGQGVRYE